MRFSGAEDRLNPIAPADADETTLGGYQAIHGRAAAFEGVDGQPYTVAVETDHSDDATPAWAAYLVFLRWAATGTAIMDHLETGDLTRAETEAEVRHALESLPLPRVKEILDATIRDKRSETGG